MLHIQSYCTIFHINGLFQLYYMQQTKSQKDLLKGKNMEMYAIEM